MPGVAPVGTSQKTVPFIAVSDCRRLQPRQNSMRAVCIPPIRWLFLAEDVAPFRGIASAIAAAFHEKPDLGNPSFLLVRRHEGGGFSHHVRENKESQMAEIALHRFGHNLIIFWVFWVVSDTHLRWYAEAD